ncbi:MAG: glycine cleavage system protein GcvH [Chloroflexi bacterium]|nr:glycine cleavage system protein GcvH [Chloroflexota bacterium]
MDTPQDLMFTTNDEWIRIEGDSATIGITNYAQDQLSDIVFIEYLIDENEEINKGEACVTVESVKASAEVYMPLSGVIIAVNEDLADMPEKVNSDPYGDAWMVKVKISDPSELNDLLDPPSYDALERDH